MNRRRFLQTGTLLGLASGVTAASRETLQDGAADRQLWANLLYKIAEPVLQNLSAGTLQKNWRVEYSPTWDNRDKKVAYLEAFGRLMMGLAPWLALPDDNTDEGRKRQKLKKYALAAVAQSVNPTGPDYMLWRSQGQPLVDAAYLAQSLLRAPEALWQPLDDTTKQRVIAEFRLLRRVVPPNNNWLLFMAMTEVFLLAQGEEADRYRIETALRAIEGWYAGDGWYSDGAAFHMDYYSSYVIHSMLVDVLTTMLQTTRKKGAVEAVKALQERLDRAVKRMQRFAEFLERFISPEGAFPAFGRSITYRTAVFQALGHTALLHNLPEGISPAQVRCGLSAVIRRMFAQPGVFDREGWLTLGFAGHQPEIADYYSNTGSMYICALGFAALGLPANEPFWTAPPAEWTARKAWSGQPFKKDYAVTY